MGDISSDRLSQLVTGGGLRTGLDSKCLEVSFSLQNIRCRVAWCCRKGFPRQGPSGWLRIAVIHRKWCCHVQIAAAKNADQVSKTLRQRTDDSVQKHQTCAVYSTVTLLWDDNDRNDRTTLPFFVNLDSNSGRNRCPQSTIYESFSRLAYHSADCRGSRHPNVLQSFTTLETEGETGIAG